MRPESSCGSELPQVSLPSTLRSGVSGDRVLLDVELEKYGPEAKSGAFDAVDPPSAAFDFPLGVGNEGGIGSAGEGGSHRDAKEREVVETAQT